MLRVSLELGLELEKIHRVLQFNQSSWLNSYFEFKKRMRENATKKTEEMFPKNINISIYGVKTMQSRRKEKDMRMVNRWNGHYHMEAFIREQNYSSS